MPIYEYQCDDCGATLEKLQRLSDAPLIDCPKCGKSALRKLVSAPSFRLKGGGWYETDFKKDKQKNLHDSARSEGKSGGSDSKPGQSESGESKKTGDAGKSDSSKKTGDAGKPDSSKKSGVNHKTSTSTN